MSLAKPNDEAPRREKASSARSFLGPESPYSSIEVRTIGRPIGSWSVFKLAWRDEVGSSLLRFLPALIFLVAATFLVAEDPQEVTGRLLYLLLGGAIALLYSLVLRRVFEDRVLSVLDVTEIDRSTKAGRSRDPSPNEDWKRVGSDWKTICEDLYGVMNRSLADKPRSETDEFIRRLRLLDSELLEVRKNRSLADKPSRETDEILRQLRLLYDERQVKKRSLADRLRSEDEKVMRHQRRLVNLYAILSRVSSLSRTRPLSSQPEGTGGAS